MLPHGTTAVAADPHEIANVFGVPGVAALAEAAARLPFTFGVCASSCVPASPFESPGAELGVPELETLLDDHGAIGVAEVMNFPASSPAIPSSGPRSPPPARRGGSTGTRPASRGRPLDAYLAAGVESDHECTELAEAEEKRRKGMWVFIREGSASRNLADLIPMVLRHGTDRSRSAATTESPTLIRELGHVNDCVRLAVATGVTLEDALVLATVNGAEYHNFHHLGSLGPGYQADVLAFDDLDSWEPARRVAGRSAGRGRRFDRRRRGSRLLGAGVDVPLRAPPAPADGRRARARAAAVGSRGG